MNPDNVSVEVYRTRDGLWRARADASTDRGPIRMYGAKRAQLDWAGQDALTMLRAELNRQASERV